MNVADDIRTVQLIDTTILNPLNFVIFFILCNIPRIPRIVVVVSVYLCIDVNTMLTNWL